MTAAALVALAAVAALAWANGSNDVSKGIATLVGSGVTDYRRAIAWGTVWTAVGGLIGAAVGGAMLTAFGKGLLSSGVTPTFAAALAALIGAAAWVLIATRTGLPVSTTHAIVGSLVGVAALAYGVEAVKWGALGSRVLVPLLISPFASLLITGALLAATRPAPGAAATGPACVCAEVVPAMLSVGALLGQATLDAPAHLRVTTGTADGCAEAQPRALKLTADHLHWLTSGATSLARGMNDAPKMVALAAGAALLLTGSPISTPALFALVTVAMVLGSLVAGRRVTRVLAENVTPMNHREGLCANLVTAGLVTAGAIYGLPMSTTHVSSGGIFSAGALRGSLDQKTLRGILLAWVVTLPAAAALGIVAYALILLVQAP